MFAETVTPATLAAVVSSTAPCPYQISTPTDWAAAHYVKDGSTSGVLGDVGVDITAPGAAIEPRLEESTRLAWIERPLDHDEPMRRDLEELRAFVREPRELLFVVGVRQPAVMLSDSYLPGTITGNAYLYSFRERRVVCATPLEVHSSAGIEFGYQYMKGNFLDETMKRDRAGQATLDRDLTVQLRYAIAAHIGAVEADVEQ